MRKQLKKHGLYYILLAVILVSGLVLFRSFASDPQVQMIVVLLTAFFYVGFALFHHFLNNDLSAKVVVEYVLMASFGVAVVYFYLT